MLIQVSICLRLFNRIKVQSSIRRVNYSYKLARERRKSLDLVKRTLEATTASANYNWKQIRESILQNEENHNQYTLENIDALILNYCIDKNTNMGLSYIDFMSNQKIKQNLATTGKYLHLLFSKNESLLLDGMKCSPEEEKHILQFYDSLRTQYPILDCSTLENAILALSVTNYWKKSLDILKEIKITSVPNNKIYSALIAAAFLNGEHSLAWELLDEMLLKEKQPLSIPFITYINSIRNSPDVKPLFEQLLSFFHQNDYVCNEDIVPHLLNFVKVMNLEGAKVNINSTGHCRHCNESLKHYELSNEEFKDLKAKFFENVIIGKDVFLKSNPEELNRFKEFLKGMNSFDVVLDGLNIAYTGGSNPPSILSARVAAVVSHFILQKKKILVLGREHMNYWPKSNWNYITKNAAVFLAQNISEDDPYLLYCTLNSGKDTILVTRDLMRGHKFLLKLPKYKILFNRWLSQRQYQLKTITNLDNKPIFRYPVPFNITCQKNGNSWHIPYGKQGDMDEHHKTWFCIKWK